MAKVRRIEKLAKIFAERGCERRHAGAGPDDVFRPSRRHNSAPDDDRGLAAELEKNRQLPHGYRAPDRIGARRAGPRGGGLRGAGVQFTRPALLGLSAFGAKRKVKMESVGRWPAAYEASICRRASRKESLET